MIIVLQAISDSNYSMSLVSSPIAKFYTFILTTLRLNYDRNLTGPSQVTKLGIQSFKSGVRPIARSLERRSLRKVPLYLEKMAICVSNTRNCCVAWHKMSDIDIYRLSLAARVEAQLELSPSLLSIIAEVKGRF